MSKKKPRRSAKSMPATQSSPAAHAAPAVDPAHTMDSAHMVDPARALHPARIELDARLSIVQAAELHRSLLARLAVGGQIVVDGSRVEEIDTAILQLLTSLWRTGLARGVACTWHGASDALRQTANLVGLAEILRFPDAAA